MFNWVLNKSLGLLQKGVTKIIIHTQDSDTLE